MRAYLSIAALLGGMWATTAAADDFQISASTVPKLKIGAGLAKGTKVTLPDRTSISFIDRTSGSPVMRTCDGKYEGPIESCPGRAAQKLPTVVPGGARSR